MNFIFANLNIITLVTWLTFFCVVMVRTLRPSLIKNLSYGLLVLVAASLHLLYGAVATWGQYRAWMSSDLTRLFLDMPLSSEVPFPLYLEWVRPFLENIHGYFAFYSFQNFFLSTMVLFIAVGLFFSFLILHARIQPNSFSKGDIILVVLAMLISGWPGVVVLLPIGFVCAVLISLISRIIYGIEHISLPPAFLVAAPIALLLAIPILTAFDLYPLLKL